ncbi:MAG: replication initiation protein [Verrucomicrobia bacterium]|nr:replication initiation protein [Verrucomicrobiota bacterium]MBV8376112.1 replication initiation protein [Verrucomicrobiota bacterium]
MTESKVRKHNKVFNTLPVPESGDQLGFGDDLIEAFYKLTPDEREIVMDIVDRLKPGVTAYDFDDFDLQPAAMKLLTYHRLVLHNGDKQNSVLYARWLSSITMIEKRMTLHLDPGVVPHLERLRNHQQEDSERASVKLASQYSIRLYEWAWKWRHIVLKRISIPQIRKVLGVDEVTDAQGNIISEKCLVHWPNLKQRAIDRALHEINEKTDLSIRLVAVGQAKYRRVLSLAFEIKEKKRKPKPNGSAAT